MNSLLATQGVLTFLALSVEPSLALENGTSPFQDFRNMFSITGKTNLDDISDSFFIQKENEKLLYIKKSNTKLPILVLNASNFYCSKKKNFIVIFLQKFHSLFLFPFFFFNFFA